MIDTFKFWCYKVLPLVYDDSLSYYEVLCKCVKYINALIDEDRGIIEDIEALKAQIEIIQQWIDDFDTEVAERIIREALANVTSVMFTSLILPEEDPDVVINRAFTNKCKTVCVDKDIHVPQTVYDEHGQVIGIDHRIYVPSGCTVRGMGGVVTFDAGSGFRVNGEVSPVVASIANYTDGETFTVSNVTQPIIAGERYKIVGTQNLFGRNDQYSLGYGTEHVGLVYGGFECVVNAVSGNSVTINRPAPYYVGPAQLCKTRDAEHVVFEHLTIVSYDHAIWMQYVNNCVVSDCTITNSTTYPLYLSSAYCCKVVHCTINQLQETGYQNNSVVLNSAGECIIDGCSLLGGYQAVDITFGHGPYYSYENMVVNNTVTGQNATSGDSLNTHPAAINNTFANNLCGRNIRIRGKGNKLYANTIGGHIVLSGRAIDGTAIIGNVSNSQQPITMSYQYAMEETDAGNETIIIANNIFTRAVSIVDGVVDGNYLIFYITNNTMIPTFTSTTTGTILAITNTSSTVPTLAGLVIQNNNFLNFSTVRVFGTAGGSVADNVFKFIGNTAGGVFTYNIGSGTVRGARSVDNSSPFTDALTSYRRNNIGVIPDGSDRPANPVTGDTFLSAAGVYQIYSGSAWLTIATS